MSLDNKVRNSNMENLIYGEVMSSNNKSNEIIDLISEIIINFIYESKSNNKSRH